MKRIIIPSFVMLLILAVASPAMAGTDTSQSVDLTATVVGACSVSTAADDYDFGNLVVDMANPANFEGSVEVTCGAGATFDVNFGNQAAINWDSTDRFMDDGTTNTLRYYFYEGTCGGAGTAWDPTRTVTITDSATGVELFTYCGEVTAADMASGTAPTAAVYTDAIPFTVSW